MKIALQIYLVDGILPFHAIYHQKFMSALVRFLATKPHRVYLFPVVIEYKKKILTKKRGPITLYFLHQWSFYISYHIFWKFSNTKRKEYLRYYYYHFLQGVPFHEKKILFVSFDAAQNKINGRFVKFFREFCIQN